MSRDTPWWASMARWPCRIPLRPTPTIRAARDVVPCFLVLSVRSGFAYGLYGEDNNEARRHVQHALTRQAAPGGRAPDLPQDLAEQLRVAREACRRMQADKDRAVEELREEVDASEVETLTKAAECFSSKEHSL